MERFDFLVVGNGIGAIVSALELAKRKYKVILQNPSTNWGGHFAGTSVNGDQFDFGMNFFEFTSFVSAHSSDLSAYDPSRKTDSGRFVKDIEQFIRGRVNCVKVPHPRMMLNGMVSKDLIISNSFEILGHLSNEIRTLIKLELSDIVAQKDNPDHASQKNREHGLFRKISYQTASLANHGKTLHHLIIEPVVNKILNLSSGDIPAVYHRIPWGPLFYPETLLSQFSSDPQLLAPTEFDIPDSGVCSTLIQSLVRELKENNNLIVLSDKVTSIKSGSGFHIQFDGGASIETARLVWGGEPEQLLQIMGNNYEVSQYSKASIAIGFMKLRDEFVRLKFSTMFVLNPDSLVYRITNHSVCSGARAGFSQISVEINYDLLNSQGFSSVSGISDYILTQLKSLGVLNQDASPDYVEVKILLNAIRNPTFMNVDLYEKAQAEMILKCGGVDFVGPSAAFSASSLNDGIVQGLKIGEKYDRN